MSLDTSDESETLNSPKNLAQARLEFRQRQTP